MADGAREGARLDAATALQVLLRRVYALGDDLAKGLFDVDAGDA